MPVPASTLVSDRPLRLGVVGTGFIAKGLLGLLGLPQFSADFVASRVLTRRAGAIEGVSPALVTQSMTQLVESSDIVVECSGDVNRAAEVVREAFAAGLPVVTMGAEFHVTLGSYFAERGLITEAEGDQPGSTAALREEAISMGFEPLVYGNIKGFLNHFPAPEEMQFWSEKNGISMAQVTSFTDGTKLQIEQALVANGLGADIAKRGLLGPKDEELDISAATLGRLAKGMGSSLSDYVLNRGLPAGVFVVGEHSATSPDVLRYLKLGEGPYYTLLRPYHLCHLEMLKTLRRVANGGGVLLNNSTKPRVNVAAVAKRDLKPGTLIETAAGGFDMRGEAVRFSEEPHAVPMGLLTGARLVRKVARGQTLAWRDVDLPDNLATQIGISLHEQRLAEVKVLPLAEPSQV